MTTNLHEKASGEVALESEWIETVESEFEPQMPVHTHFQRILQRCGLPTVSSLRNLFMMFARPSLASINPQLVRMFDAIAVPGGILVSRLRPGDVLLRYIPGEGYVHVAFIRSSHLLLPEQAISQGWTLETVRPGYFGIVVEAGAVPHRADQHFARCILNARGVMPQNQLILRLRRAPIHESVDEQIQAENIEQTRSDNIDEQTQSENLDEQSQPEDLDDWLGLDEDAESVLIEDIYESNPPPMIPAKLPMAVPSSSPAPFAPLPPANSYWPIITNHRQGRTVSYTADDGSVVGQSARRWLADRSGGARYHIGIDLFGNYGDPVVAIEDGEIIDFRPFCCGANKTTNSLLVAHSNVVVNYGEVDPDSLRRNGLSRGSRVSAGQVIAYIGRNPGGSTMIHFETYAPGTHRTNRWMKNQARPDNVLNPTRYLLHLQEHGLVGTGRGTPGTTPPITPVTPVTPGTTANRRSPAYIRWVQSSLNQINSVGLVVDGISGPRTREAVRNFPAQPGLSVDGIVGPQTEATLIAAGSTFPPVPIGEKLLSDVAEGGSPNRRSPAYIRWVQSSLNQVNNARLVVDGISGSRTREAVRNFQRSRGLSVDGIVGPQTEAALVAAGAPPPPGTMPTIPTIPIPVPPIPTPTPQTNWAFINPNERMRYVMDLLVREYLYPVNGAAGLVGNLWAESGVLPNRVEGSPVTAPMTAPDFNGRRVEFTAEQVMNRNRLTRQGPRLPGVGLAQWTTPSRRAGLFLHTFQGQHLEADILYNMDAQVNYLVTELQNRYRSVDNLLRRANVSLEDASDEVVYNFEVPGSILSPPSADGKRHKLPRNSPAVIEIFERRRRYARNALRTYNSATPSPFSGGEELTFDGAESESPNRRSPAYIRWVQSSLNQVNNAGLVVDGISGPRTREAVHNFQRSQGLTIDGIVGPQTEAALIAAGAPLPPTPGGGIPPVPPPPPITPTPLAGWSDALGWNQQINQVYQDGTTTSPAAGGASVWRIPLKD